jgi:hypothetical protein
VFFRIGWNVGDLDHGLLYIPAGTNQAPVLGTGAFYLLNMGQVRLDPTPIGNQQWQARIEAINATGVASNASVDMLYLQPLDESAGQLTGNVTYAPHDVVMLANGRLQMRYDSMVRTILGGLVFAPVMEVGGDLPRIPPSGLEGLPVQIFLKPSRGNLSETNYPDAGIDNFTVSVSYRPSYLFRP